MAGSYDREEVIKYAQLLTGLGRQIEGAERSSERTSEVAALNEVRYSNPESKSAAEQLAQKLAGALENKQAVSLEKVADSQAEIANRAL